MNLSARLFLFIFLSFITLYFSSLISHLSFFNPPPAFAQTQNSESSYNTPNTDPNVPKNLHTWTQNVMLEVVSAMSCELGGVDPTNPNQPCLGVDQKSGKIGFVPNGGGAVGVMGSLIAMTFTPPIHTGDYFNYLSQNFGIAKHAYAATDCSKDPRGIGFCGLTPLVGLWSAFRNIVYLLFVIVFVVIGLAIMLRVKIDPRTVMSIENQIPKIIIGILLVTFSFAIAGFLVDMMYVSIYLVYGTISNVSVVKSDPTISTFAPANLQNSTPMGAIGGLGGVNGIANNVALNTSGIIKTNLGISNKWFGVNIDPSKGFNFKQIIKIDGSFGICLKIFTTCRSGGHFALQLPKITANLGLISWTDQVNFSDFAIDMISLGTGFTLFKTAASIDIPAVGALTGIPLATLGVGAMETTLRQLIPWLIPYLIIMIALLWALFRLWFQLIMAYVFILIDVVLAPFWIAAGILPGSSIGFGAWLRDIIANLSAFPITITMFLLGKVFIDAFNSSNNSLFVPPLIGNLTGGNANPIGSLIGLGIILMTPQVVTMMKEALKAPQFKYTAAIGQAVGAGAGAPGRAIGGGTQLAFGTQYNKEGGIAGQGGTVGKFMRAFGFAH